MKCGSFGAHKRILGVEVIQFTFQLPQRGVVLVQQQCLFELVSSQYHLALMNLKENAHKMAGEVVITVFDRLSHICLSSPKLSCFYGCEHKVLTRQGTDEVFEC